jgi:hypothetical protein
MAKSFQQEQRLMARSLFSVGKTQGGQLMIVPSSASAMAGEVAVRLVVALTKTRRNR